MKKLLCLFFIPFALVSCSSFEGKRKIAQTVEDSPVTKVEDAKYICGDNKGGYALKTSAPARFWQVDTKDSADEGLELSNISLNSKRCINCFTVNGNIRFMDQEMQVEATTSGMVDVEMSVIVKSDGDTIIKRKYKCEKAK